MIPDNNSNDQSKQLLIIDDEANMRHMLRALLSKSGYQVETASDGREGLELTSQKAYDFVLCDLKMPNMGGMAFLEAVKPQLKTTTIIMMSAYGTVDTALDAMKQGAYDYISKPFKSDEVLLTLKKAEERESLKKENIHLKTKIRNIEKNYNFGNMIAKSKAMQAVFKLAEKVAHYNTTVLINGESGTGKELIARGIHFNGNRRQSPLVTINCGSIPENLLESELFGYRKGAFTGAERDKKGLFQEANGGTIFLDEIGELPTPLQVKLLRVLQENEIRPIGDAKTQTIDVRVIAATARDLSKEVENGAFRQDLFYRLNVLPIELPPLRKRPEDIPLLCQFFIEQFNQKLNKKIKGIAPAAMNRLMAHHWPGNVRELENIIERGVVYAEERILEDQDFPPTLGGESNAARIEKVFDGFSIKQAQRLIEKKLIIRALTETGGNRTRAAHLLEISHPSLLAKMKTYDISM